MSVLNGDAPEHEQDGQQLVAAAQRARTAYGQSMSPQDRDMLAKSLPPVLDDSQITPPPKPHQTAERVTSRTLTSFDL